MLTHLNRGPPLVLQLIYNLPRRAHIFEDIIQVVYSRLLFVLLVPIQNGQNVSFTGIFAEFIQVVFPFGLHLELNFVRVIVLDVLLQDVGDFTEIFNDVAP